MYKARGGCGSFWPMRREMQLLTPSMPHQLRSIWPLQCMTPPLLVETKISFRLWRRLILEVSGCCWCTELSLTRLSFLFHLSFFFGQSSCAWYPTCAPNYDQGLHELKSRTVPDQPRTIQSPCIQTVGEGRLVEKVADMESLVFR